MKRPSEYLTPLAGLPKRRQFIVADIESKDGPTQRAGFTRPFLVGARKDGKQLFFRNQSHSEIWDEAYFLPGGCIDGFMRWTLQKTHQGNVIYAHNGGRFDWLFILPWLARVGSELGYDFEVIPAQSSIQILDVWRRGKRKSRWRFLDSFKLIPTSLDKASKAFGFTGKLDHDLDLPEDDISWESYLKTDCEQLELVISRFHDLVERLGGEVGVTAPSTSMKLFRRNYLEKPIPRVRVLHDFFERSYVGGWTDVFRTTGHGLRYYDFNSSYPAAMLEPMPVGSAWVFTGDPPDWVFDDQHVGFVEADIRIPESCNIPPLPIKLQDKLCHPVGKLHGIWDWAELSLLHRVGGEIVRWGQSVWFKGEPIFRQMVLDLYPYRDKARSDYYEGLSQVVKILLNSLYGKFGQKTTRRRIIFAGPGIQIPEEAEPADPNNVDSLVWYVKEETDPGYRMPQIASHVTSLARARLWKEMNYVESLGGRVYYCDTDSIICDIKLQSYTELGYLKDEYPGHTFTGEFIQPKLYILSDEGLILVRSKGLESMRQKGESDRDRSLRHISQIRSYAAGGVLHFDRLEKIGSLAREGFKRGPRMRNIPKSMHGVVQKRQLLPDGSTKPLVVEMW